MCVGEGGSVREGEGLRMIVFSLLLLVAGGQGRQAPCTHIQARQLQAATGSYSGCMVDSGRSS